MSQAALRWSRNLLAFPLALLLVVVLSGCGASVARVSGKVTYQGKDLTSGTVNFIGPDNKVAPDSAIIQPDGTYTAGKVPIGANKITVTTSAGSAGGLPPQQPLPGMPSVPTAVAIPGKYGNPETSGLTLDVKPGRQTFDIPLQ
jgi:hypothetical protein